jgi:hypothetical protein
MAWWDKIAIELFVKINVISTLIVQIKLIIKNRKIVHKPSVLNLAKARAYHFQLMQRSFIRFLF